VPRRKASTHDRILDTLRRRGPCTVTELARRFRVSTMAVRLQLGALVKKGWVGSEETRPSKGRPARVYSLTESSRCCFPERAGPLALEVLEEMEGIAGRDVVVKAMERRARRLGDAWHRELEGKPLEEKLRLLARFRDEEGYVAESGPGDGRSQELVERHCPIAALAERWPEVCRIEEEMFRRVLGTSIERTEHLLSGGSCCRYRVDGEV
jgi:predicted ArsR family transcriptional regulator